jgi:hypothetical protein
MADYYPLINKAVSGLDKSTGESRRGLYDRARTALLEQLRSAQPALSEGEITRERLALEEAIRKVETEAARRSRTDPPPPRSQPRKPADANPVPPLDFPPLGVARQVTMPQISAAPAETVDNIEESGDFSAARQGPAVPPGSTQRLQAKTQLPVARPPSGESSPQDASDRTVEPPRPVVPAEQARTDRRASLSDQGLKGFRDLFGESPPRGEPTPTAKNAQDDPIAPPPRAPLPTPLESPESRPDRRLGITERRADTREEPPVRYGTRPEIRAERRPERLPPPGIHEAREECDEPRSDPRSADLDPRDEPRAERQAWDVPWSEPRMLGGPRAEPRSDTREPRFDAFNQRTEPPPEDESPLPRRASGSAGDKLPRNGAVNRGRDGRQLGRQETERPPAFQPPDFEEVTRAEPRHEHGFEQAADYSSRPPSSPARRTEGAKPRPRPSRDGLDHAPATTYPQSWKRIAALSILGVLALALAAIGVIKGPGMFASWRDAGRTALSGADSTGKGGKIADRAPSVSSQSDDALVAQKVVLYEEDQNDPAGRRYVGSVVWRSDRSPPAPGQAPDLAIRADIDIPEQHIGARWSLRRNDDKTLPASHTVEIIFTLPPDFAHGGVDKIPGVLMKTGESTRGMPLAGLAVKVTNNFFLIGLSSAESDMQRNLQLLKERPWFDIPIIYTDGKRAILAIEKGTPGERVFADAFTAWGQ